MFVVPMLMKLGNVETIDHVYLSRPLKGTGSPYGIFDAYARQILWARYCLATICNVYGEPSQCTAGGLYHFAADVELISRIPWSSCGPCGSNSFFLPYKTFHEIILPLGGDFEST